jgi:uncharacterized membrane protein
MAASAPLPVGSVEGHEALRRARAAFVALAAAAVFTGSFMLLHHSFWGRHQLVDTPLYEAYADSVRAGDVPYANFRLEYPPGALAAFMAPELTSVPGRFGTYGHAFEKWMAGCGIAMTLLVALALARLSADPRHVLGALALVAVSPLLLGPVLLSRFDLLPAMLTVGALAALVWGRPRIGVVVLAAAGATKLYPLVALPVVLLWVARTRGRREAAICGAAGAVTLTAFFAPFAVVSPAGLSHSLAVQASRPLQVESLGATFLVVLHHLAGFHVTLHEDHGSKNILGATAGAIGGVATLLQLAALLLVGVLFARGPTDRDRLALAFAASVTAFVTFGKVLSPQYMIWLVPLVPLVPGPARWKAGALLAAALVLTQLWFPDRYGQYADHLRLTESLLVLARDLVLVAVFAVLVRALRPGRLAVLEARTP